MASYKKRKIPRINSGSSADIAFLLLIFFLVTSSLDARTGIYRKLNASSPEEVLKERKDIEQRNLLTFTLDSLNQIIYEEEVITLPDVRDLSKTFVSNPNDVDFLPEKEIIEIPEVGEYSVTTQHVILLKIDRKAKYEAYIQIINELTAAYNQLRNNVSNEIFNTAFYNLTPERQEAIRMIYPLHISEIEIPEKEGGKK